MKKAVLAVLLAILLVACTGCDGISYNKQMVDTTYGFEYAYISLPGGRVIEGTVESWTDFEDGDQLQVTIDGKTYLTHATNVVLVHTRRNNQEDVTR